jgi:hypothetical protein
VFAALRIASTSFLYAEQWSFPGFVADRSGVFVHRRDFERGAERIGDCELVLDVGIVEHLVEGFPAAAIRDRAAAAVPPDQILL